MFFKKFRGESPITLMGVYQYPPNENLFQETLAIQWGEELSQEELAEAKTRVAEHFENLFLVEITSTQPLADFDWTTITQKENGLSRNNWQVPYDERQLDNEGCHWSFFFHYLKLNKPLITPYGKLPLPKPGKLPTHLEGITYEPPG